MTAAEPAAAGTGGPMRPGGLLDVLNVASVVLDARGRIVLWSPQAETLFGYPAEEALGRYAAQVMVHERHVELVVKLFADVVRTGQSWAGAFPIRRKDGSVRLIEFRNMRLLDDHGDVYALGLAADRPTLRQVEQDLALSTRLVSQSPVGLAVLDTDLRYVSVNPALERIDGVPADAHLGRTLREVVPLLDADALEAAARKVLRTGEPVVDRATVGRTPADPDEDHAWSMSLYRLEDARGAVLGVAVSVVDVTEQHRAGVEAEAARRRLALVADASARIGTTLDLERTARELADVAVPELADVAAVDLLDAVVAGRPGTFGPTESAVIRALAVRAYASPRRWRRPTRPARSPATGPTGWSPSACARAARCWCPRWPTTTTSASPAPPRRPCCCAGRASTRTWPCRSSRAARCSAPWTSSGPSTPNPSPRTTCCWPGNWRRARPCRSTTPAGTRTPAPPRSPSSAACCPVTRRSPAAWRWPPATSRPAPPPRSAATGST